MLSSSNICQSHSLVELSQDIALQRVADNQDMHSGDACRSRLISPIAATEWYLIEPE